MWSRYNNCLWHAAKPNGVLSQRGASPNQGLSRRTQPRIVAQGRTRDEDGEEQAPDAEDWRVGYDIGDAEREAALLEEYGGRSACRRKIGIGYRGYGAPAGCQFFVEDLAKPPADPQELQLLASRMPSEAMAARVLEGEEHAEARAATVEALLKAVGRRDVEAFHAELGRLHPGTTCRE